MTIIDTDLYHEVRGHGPAVLFISGATGDAGHYSRTAEVLADEFTVITYDRRGNSRSRSNADGQNSATIAAQADDAAALIRAFELGKTVVFGSSGGGVITLDLISRHPEVVRGAIVHEPPLLGVLPHDDGPSPLDEVFALAETDAPAALEAFVRLNSSDTAWDNADPATRDRMLGNADTLFQREVMQFITYQPEIAALACTPVPVELLHGVDGLPFIPAVNGWLLANLGWTSSPIGGHHAPYLDTADTFAEEIRPLLKGMAQQA